LHWVWCMWPRAVPCFAHTQRKTCTQRFVHSLDIAILLWSAFPPLHPCCLGLASADVNYGGIQTGSLPQVGAEARHMGRRRQAHAKGRVGRWWQRRWRRTSQRAPSSPPRFFSEPITRAPADAGSNGVDEEAIAERLSQHGESTRRAWREDDGRGTRADACARRGGPVWPPT
jgi:hypothetical protein